MINVKSTIELYDKVKIKKTGELAYVVHICESGSYMLEIIDKNEMPAFYESDEFEKVEE